MTTLTSPIAKLYKRCARNHHDSCPGSFETWSICSCDCHAGVSDTRAAPSLDVDKCRDCRHGMHVECHSPSCPCPCSTTEFPIAKKPARPAPEKPVTCADKQGAVSEAIAIVSPTPARMVKASGLTTKTDKFAKWANAIVAKNSRIRIAAEESMARRGLKPATIGMAANRIRTPRCEHCHEYMRVEWLDHYDINSTVIIVPCGCQEKGG